MAASTTYYHIVSNAERIAIYSLERPIEIGYDSIEGYMTLLKLFICVSATLQPRRGPDEVHFGMAASTRWPPATL
eukprot:scaffold22512_cov98-Skeletonema_marinoi.AAC.3